MIRTIFCVLLTVVFTPRAVAGQAYSFPPGTSQFFDVELRDLADALPAEEGGVWVATAEGIVRYTAGGKRTVLPVPGGSAFQLALAADGTIWFANDAFIGRITTGGSVVEQYSIAGVLDLAVASDGALWYIADLGDVTGRIAGGTPVELDLDDTWSLAPADGGDMWVLSSGSASSPKALYRVTPTGTVTTHPLGVDTLYGKLQVLADGTLYVGTGIAGQGLLRLVPDPVRFTRVSTFTDEHYLVDDAGNIWSSTVSTLHYQAASGGTRFSVELPQNPQTEECEVNVEVFAYRPLMMDSEDGLWIAIYDGGNYVPLPCPLPPPPERPTLIRIDTRALVLANAGPSSVPALSPAMLAGLAALLIAIAATRLRAS